METIFESKRINFVKISESLVKEYLDMVNDVENVERFIGPLHDPYTEEQEIKWIKDKLEEKAFVLSMIEKATGEFVGNIEYMDLNEENAELGIAITFKKQNQGFGREAIKAILNYGKNTLHLKTVYLRTHLDNYRAMHVYNICGFKEYKRTDQVYMMIDLTTI